MDRRRRRVRWTAPLDAPGPGVPLVASGPTPDRDPHRRLLAERLRAALAQLPQRRRLAIVLFDVDGYSQHEIAAILGIPAGTVRSDVFQARRALRGVLGDWRDDRERGDHDSG
jgi:RNA polymerase sigma factor (sigma-70 family)